MAAELNEVSVPLTDIVEQYIISKGEGGNSNKLRYITLAQHGLKELNFDVSGVPKIDRLCADEHNKSIYYLPKDLIKIRRVFTIGRNGTIELSMNQQMSPVIDECETPQSTGINQPGNKIPYNPGTQPYRASDAAKWRGGLNMGGYFGIGGGTTYQYRLNVEEGRIEVSDNLYGRSNLFVEYIGRPTKMNGKTMIHPFIAEPLLEWIAYVDIRHKKRVPANQKELARRNFYAAKHHAKLRFTSLSVRQMIDARRQGFKQSPKY